MRSSLPVIAYACVVAAAVACGGNKSSEKQEATEPPKPAAPPPIAEDKACEVRRGLAAGGNAVCLIDSGRVRCIGTAFALSGLLEHPISPFDDTLTNTERRENARHNLTLRTLEVDSIGMASALAVGTMHACAVTCDGGVACWGNNLASELGHGERGMTGEPGFVPGLEDAVDVAAGYKHSCALLGSGRVHCWGTGLLGAEDSRTQTMIPVQVAGLTDAVAVAAGYKHTCAIRQTGKVVCWGDGLVPPVSGAYFPIAIPELNEANQLALGHMLSCALDKAGHVSCWGSNTGARVDPYAEPLALPHASTTPTQVKLTAPAVELVAGRDHVCARHADDRLSCWGRDIYGETKAPGAAASAPVRVLTDQPKLTAVAAGEKFTCAQHEHQTVRCWGELAAANGPEQIYP